MTLHDDVDVTLAKQTLRLLPEKVALWLERNMLLVADLHFGKATTFQALGVAVPRGHGEADLTKLAEICKKVKPSSVAVLGDLFHAPAGVSEALVSSIATVFKTLETAIFWIAGNHDRQLHKLAETLGMRLEKTMRLDDLELSHQPKTTATACVCGHLHPRVQLWSQKQKLELPCFVREKTRLILPAFSSFSAGTTIKAAPNRQRFACADNQLLEL
jgi:uncharacterized protein